MATTESKVIVKLEAEIGKLTTELNRANTKLSKFEKSTSQITKKVGKSFSRVGTSIKVALAGITLGKISQLSDEFTNINTRLKLVTNSTEDFAKAQKAVFRIAQETRQPLSNVAQIYQRFAQASSELAGDTTRLTGVVEVVNKVIAASGVTARSAEAAIVQLGQALASGRFQGEEFNSVVEQTPALAQAIADGFGSTIGQLRQLSRQGVLTTDLLVTALENQSSAVDSKFRKIQMTIGQPMTVLENAFTMVIGQSTTTSGAVGGVTDAILEMAEVVSRPEVKDGLSKLFQGAVESASGFVSLLSKIANGFDYVGTGIGEGLARLISGEEGVDDMQKRLEHLQNSLKQIDPSNTYLIEAYSKDISELITKLEALGVSHRAATKEITTPPPSSVLAPPTKPQGSGLLGAPAPGKFETNPKKFFSDRIAELRLAALSEEERAVKRLQQKYEELARGVREGHLPGAEAAQIAAGLALNEESLNPVEAVEEEVQKSFTNLQEMAANAAEGMQQAFSDFLIEPSKEGFHDMADNFAKTIQRMTVDMMASELFNWVGGKFGGESDENGGGAFTNFFAGLFADGGVIPSNNMAIVGENGPELIHSGSAPKTVIPNDQLGGNTYNINIKPNLTGGESDAAIKRSASQLASEVKRELGRA